MNVTASIIYFLKGLLMLYENLPPEGLQVAPNQSQQQENWENAVCEDKNDINAGPRLNSFTKNDNGITESYQESDVQKPNEGKGVTGNTCSIDPNIAKHPNWNLVNNDLCGISNTDRIIGGRLAHLGQYPWIALLGYEDDNETVYRCAGSVLNQYYVITAAHCAYKPVLPLIHVSIGENDLRTAIDCEDNICAPEHQIIEIKEAIVHPGYKKATYKNDVALLHLKRPVEFNDFVRPICLTNDCTLQKNLMNTTLDVAGWGKSFYQAETLSPVLLHVNLKVSEMERCRKVFRKLNPGTGQICVGGDIGKDTCGGDSGGPLMMPGNINGAPKTILVGMVSYGVARCGISAIPAVYTDLRCFLHFILNNIKE